MSKKEQRKNAYEIGEEREVELVEYLRKELPSYSFTWNKTIPGWTNFQDKLYGDINGDNNVVEVLVDSKLGKGLINGYFSVEIALSCIEDFQGTGIILTPLQFSPDHSLYIQQSRIRDLRFMFEEIKMTWSGKPGILVHTRGLAGISWAYSFTDFVSRLKKNDYSIINTEIKRGLKYLSPQV